MEVVNNREVAYVIWVLLVVAVLFLNNAFREFVANVLQILSKFKFIAILLVSLLYMMLVVGVYFPEQYGRPRFYLLFLVWFVLGALPSMWKAVGDAGEIRFDRFWYWLKTTFSATTVVTFISGFNSFSIPLELLFVPLSVVLVAFILQNKYHTIKVFGNILLTFAGFVFVINSCYKIAIDFDSFASIENISNIYILFSAQMKLDFF